MATKKQKHFFLCLLALPRGGQDLCGRRKITMCTNNGSHVCMEWYTTCLCSFSRYLAQQLTEP